MNTTQPRLALRSLSGLLLLVRGILSLITILLIPLAIFALSGRGTATVNGVLDAPFQLDFADGRSLEVAGESMSYINFDIGEERDTIQSAPVVSAALQVQRDDLDSRATAIAFGAAYLAAAWIGLLSLDRVVRSAVAGNPFTAENPRRLRRLGAAVLVVPLLTFAAQFVLNRTIDTDLPFRVALGTANWWVLLIIGLGVMALAEPFAEGARLREMDEATI